MGNTTTAPAVYVGKYHKYNCSSIFGKWFDLTEFEGREAVFLAWAEYSGECDYDTFDDAYRSEAESEADYVQEMIEDYGLLNEVPEPLRSYFDFEAYARDLFSSGYVFHFWRSM